MLVRCPVVALSCYRGVRLSHCCAAMLSRLHTVPAPGCYIVVVSQCRAAQAVTFSRCHGVSPPCCRGVSLSQQCHCAVILPYCHSVKLSRCHSSCCHAVVLSHCRAVTLSGCRTIVLFRRDTVRLLRCQAIMLFHCGDIALSHHHVVPLLRG